MERLMRHFSANEYRDSWAERERAGGQGRWGVGGPPDPPPHLGSPLRKECSCPFSLGLGRWQRWPILQS